MFKLPNMPKLPINLPSKAAIGAIKKYVYLAFIGLQVTEMLTPEPPKGSKKSSDD